jgi:hypothetical protein
MQIIHFEAYHSACCIIEISYFIHMRAYAIITAETMRLIYITQNVLLPGLYF